MEHSAAQYGERAPPGVAAIEWGLSNAALVGDSERIAYGVMGEKEGGVIPMEEIAMGGGWYSWCCRGLLSGWV